MNDRIERRRAFIINVLYFAIAAMIIYFCFRYVIGWLMPFILGFVIALIVRPLIAFLNRRTSSAAGAHNFWSVAVLTIAYLLVGALVWALISHLSLSLIELFKNMPDIYNNDIHPFIQDANLALSALTRSLSPALQAQINPLMDSLAQNLRDGAVWFSRSALTIAAGVTSRFPAFLIAFIFTIVSSVMISMDFEQIVRFIDRQLSPGARAMIFDIKEHLVKTVFRYLRAYLILALITFAELAVGLSVLRVKYALGIAVLIAILDALPVIGTGGIIIPWAIISFFTGEAVTGLGLLILYAVVLVVRNIIEPKILGDQLGLNPLVTIIALYVGFRIMGVGGMILVPIALNIIVGLHRSNKLHIWN